MFPPLRETCEKFLATGLGHFDLYSILLMIVRVVLLSCLSSGLKMHTSSTFSNLPVTYLWVGSPFESSAKSSSFFQYFRTHFKQKGNESHYAKTTKERKNGPRMAAITVAQHYSTGWDCQTAGEH